MQESTFNVIKSFLVRGYKVDILANGSLRIKAKTNVECQMIYKYMIAEGMITLPSQDDGGCDGHGGCGGDCEC